MRLSRRFMPLAAGLMLALVTVTPARAQGMDAVLQILVEVLAASVQQDQLEHSAERDLEAELDYIHEEKARVSEDFAQRRWEVKQVAKRSIREIKDYVRRKHERRRQIREVKRWRDQELARLADEEAWQLEQLDRRREVAERRYDDQIRYGGFLPGQRQIGVYNSVGEVFQIR